MEIKITGNCKRATNGSVGVDLICSKTTLLHKNRYTLIPTTFQTIIPKGVVALITPRSSSALKKGIEVVLGTIDCDYRGTWGIVARAVSDVDYIIQDQKDKISKYEDCCNVVEEGECIAQAVFFNANDLQFTEISKEQYDNFVKQEQNNQRGEGGFGSTGV